MTISSLTRIKNKAKNKLKEISIKIIFTITETTWRLHHSLNSFTESFKMQGVEIAVVRLFLWSDACCPMTIRTNEHTLAGYDLCDMCDDRKDENKYSWEKLNSRQHSSAAVTSPVSYRHLLFIRELRYIYAETKMYPLNSFRPRPRHLHHTCLSSLLLDSNVELLEEREYLNITKAL